MLRQQLFGGFHAGAWSGSDVEDVSVLTAEQGADPAPPTSEQLASIEHVPQGVVGRHGVAGAQGHGPLHGGVDVLPSAVQITVSQGQQRGVGGEGGGGPIANLTADQVRRPFRYSHGLHHSAHRLTNYIGSLESAMGPCLAEGSD